MAANFDLDPVQWSTLRRLLDTALELAPAERGTWVEHLSGEYEPFKARLRALLEHAGATGRSPLDTLPKVETAQFLAERAASAATLAPGTLIGPYRVIRPLGEGGMGSVWLAERADGLLQRPVALKLPRLYSDREGLAERLARERDFLATLSHPNIARLYDAGVTDDGRPYLALEYVEGQHIDAYCKQHALDARARLKLVLQIAHAVAHAHAKLIVHRDLKPANILVTADGQVRLLDFGIAKLIESGSAEATELTRFAGRALTPEYAAPEQIARQPLSTATDVYSLGVVCYELLCGQRPYRPKRDSPAALEEEILRTDAPAPSTVVGDAARRKALRGDLDTIVLKALKKRPDERYGTVNALAEDIERYLSNRPVLAQPDSVWYRARKFAVRNRVAVGTAVLVFLTVTLVAAVAVWQAQVATRAQRRAEHVKSFIASVITEADPYAAAAGRATTALELLNRARERLAGELADQPEVRAEMLRLLGKSYSGLFDLQTAEVVLAQGLNETKALARSASGDLDIAETQVALGEVKNMLGKRDEGRALLADALALTWPDAANERRSDIYADAKLLEAGLALSDGDYAATIVAAEEAIRTSTGVHGEVNPRAASGYGLISKSPGATAEHQRRALDAAHKSYTMRRQLHAGSSRPHPSVIEAQHDYGVALLGMGELKPAAVHVAQSLADARSLYGTSSILAGHFGVRLGQIHILQGELEQGVREVRDAVELLAKIDPGQSIASAGRLRTLGLGLLWLHRPQDALPVLRNVIAILEERKDERATLIARADYAMALLESGRHREAGELLASVDEAGSALQPQERPLRALARRELLRGNAAAAKALLLPALEAAERDPRRFFLPDTLIDLGRAQFELGEFDAAAARAQAALQELDRRAVAVTPNHAAAWSVLGRSRLKNGSAAEALDLLERSDHAWLSLAPQSHWTGENAYWLARAYRALGREREAVRTASRAARLLGESPHPAGARLVAQMRTR